MSKYDFDVDLSDNSSTGLILNRLKPASVVLEFGCATGRMTKYMKEKLACEVYIVEIDKEAYDVAINYAVDGVCGDILKYEWREKFASIRFDAIIFADVLEHLTRPEEALSKAAQLLGEDGMIYVSIPNITHNDILTKAVEERFDYTEIGLLDNTHVHFWGRHNIDILAEQCGLKLGWITGTTCPSGITEQYYGTDYNADRVLLNFLKERVYGEIYQFVFSLVKTSGTETGIEFKKPEIKSSIYYDSGNDFNETEMIKTSAVLNDEGRYVFHYVVNSTAGIKRIRIDPVELQGCIINNMSFLQGNNELVPMYSDHVELSDGVLLLGDDPMVILGCTGREDPVEIHADILLAGTEYVNKLEREFLYKQKEKGSRINELLTEKSDMQKLIQELKNNNEMLLNETQKMNHKINELSDLYQACQIDLGAYAVLSDSKDKLLIEKDKLLIEKEQLLIEKDNEIERYRNMIGVRIWEIIKRILRKIKRIAKRMLALN